MCKLLLLNQEYASQGTLFFSICHWNFNHFMSLNHIFIYHDVLHTANTSSYYKLKYSTDPRKKTINGIPLDMFFYFYNATTEHVKTIPEIITEGIVPSKVYSGNVQGFSRTLILGTALRQILVKRGRVVLLRQWVRKKENVKALEGHVLTSCGGKEDTQSNSVDRWWWLCLCWNSHFCVLEPSSKSSFKWMQELLV